MASFSLQMLLAMALAVSCVRALGDTYHQMYEPDSNEEEYSLPGILGTHSGERQNTVRSIYAPYTHDLKPALGECGDCGFVIVEKRHHYCIPGKSVIKVLRRKPTCNCKPTVGGSNSYYGSESNLAPHYELPPKGSDPVFRMLRGLMEKRENADSGTVGLDKSSTPQYRTLDASTAPRNYN
uniref:Uncharacterized protein n=1 Tax=Anopheles albimanus TaxID=7167 RepID=A0A182FFE9_ANOAL